MTVSIDDVKKLEIKKDEILMIKGNWSPDTVELFSVMLKQLGHNTMIVMMPENGTLESTPIGQFYDMMKACEKRIGLDKI